MRRLATEIRAHGGRRSRDNAEDAGGHEEWQEIKEERIPTLSQTARKGRAPSSIFVEKTRPG
jgi:hypothetical protein